MFYKDAVIFEGISKPSKYYPSSLIWFFSFLMKYLQIPNMSTKSRIDETTDPPIIMILLSVSEAKLFLLEQRTNVS